MDNVEQMKLWASLPTRAIMIFGANSEKIGARNSFAFEHPEKVRSSKTPASLVRRRCAASRRFKNSRAYLRPRSERWAIAGRNLNLMTCFYAPTNCHDL